MHKLVSYGISWQFAMTKRKFDELDVQTRCWKGGKKVTKDTHYVDMNWARHSHGQSFDGRVLLHGMLCCVHVLTSV